MKKCIFLLLLASSLACTVAKAQTGSEIYLVDMKVKKSKILLSNPRNVTNHKGYDNQPSFHSTEPILYYSSFNSEGRSDIKSYNYENRETRQITNTNEREYSPTLTPDKQYISCIVQRDNGAQDLGQYPIEGGEATVIINDLTVGYHLWADKSHLALFILGDPVTLHYLQLPDKKDTVIATNIGRSLHRVPNEQAISFVHKVSNTEWFIKKLDIIKMTVTTIAPTLPGREDITWTPNGILLSSDGTDIFQWKTGKWEKVMLPKAPHDIKGITRLAVNGKGSLLAAVVAE